MPYWEGQAGIDEHSAFIAYSNTQCSCRFHWRRPRGITGGGLVAVVLVVAWVGNPGCPGGRRKITCGVLKLKSTGPGCTGESASRQVGRQGSQGRLVRRSRTSAVSGNKGKPGARRPSPSSFQGLDGDRIGAGNRAPAEGQQLIVNGQGAGMVTAQEGLDHLLESGARPDGWPPLTTPTAPNGPASAG